MNFQDEINRYEDDINDFIYISNDGDVPVMFTAIHTVTQNKETGIKMAEPYTSAVCQYVGNKINGSYFIKAIDNGIDSNSLIEDEFKQLLLKKIKDNNIKFLFDIHGAKETYGFDVELGTLNNMSSQSSTITNLINCFKKNGINKIAINSPFKGGGLTKYIYENTNIDIIQLEISHAYRDFNNINECKKICDSLIEFVDKYVEE